MKRIYVPIMVFVNRYTVILKPVVCSTVILPLTNWIYFKINLVCFTGFITVHLKFKTNRILVPET